MINLHHVIMFLIWYNKQKYLKLISESDRRADFWSNILEATAPSQRANKVMEVLGYSTICVTAQQHSSEFSSFPLMLFYKKYLENIIY